MVREHLDVAPSRQGAGEVGRKRIAQVAGRHEHERLSHGVTIAGQGLPDPTLRPFSEFSARYRLQPVPQRCNLHRTFERTPPGNARWPEHLDLPRTLDSHHRRFGTEQPAREPLRIAHGGAASAELELKLQTTCRPFDVHPIVA